MSLCESIDTLSMAYLDEELAAEEQRELELHLTECASCRAHVDDERAEHELLRAALAAPPAPDITRVRIARALDAEDRQTARADRRRWSSYLLPGSAVLAAAAAIAVFVGVRPPTEQVSAVAKEALRQGTRTLPFEVQGASTGSWLNEHFAPSMQPPQFADSGIRLVGARLSAVNGHDSALLSYQINTGTGPFVLTALVLRDVRGDELAEGDEVQVGNRMLHVFEYKGQLAVTYVDPDHMGYMFFAPDLSTDDLVRLVVSSDLIARAQQGR